MQVLILENDPPLSHFLRQSVISENYEVASGAAANCVTGLPTPDYDAILLDLDIGSGDSFLLLREARVSKPAAVILVLSAAASVSDRVHILEAGADDVLSKPFSIAELSLRLRGLLRRCRSASGSILRVGDLELDRTERAVRRAGTPLKLSTKEFALLEYLMRNTGRAVSREMIFEHVWGLALGGRSNLVDVYFAYVRSSVDIPGRPSLIRTVRGTGYMIPTAQTGESMRACSPAVAPSETAAQAAD